MENTPKGFRVELDQPLKVCFLKVWGIWTEEDGIAYVRFFSSKLAPFVGAEFDVVADISEFPMQTPEVNAQIQETMRHAAASGMQRAANIVSSAMTKMQIDRISKETGLPVFSFFKSVNDGVQWLRPETWKKAISARPGWR